MSMEAGKLLFFLSAMDYLWHNGFYQMSRPVKNNEGELYVGSGPDLYFLTEWVEGSYPDFSRGEQVDAAVSLLADFHRKGEGFDPPQDCIPRNNLGQWSDKWQQRIKDLKKMKELAKEKKDDFDQIFLKIVNIALDEASQALNVIESAGYLDFSQSQRVLKPLCHRDFVYHNLLFRDGVTFLIDFEYCVQDSRVIDLARFIRTTFIHHPWEIETAERIIWGYQDRYPLTLTEQRMLMAVLIFPHDIWRIGHKWYLSGKKKRALYHLLCRQCQCYNQKYQMLKKLEQGFLSL
jgi:CotS family spore coat protein